MMVAAGATGGKVGDSDGVGVGERELQWRRSSNGFLRGYRGNQGTNRLSRTSAGAGAARLQERAGQRAAGEQQGGGPLVNSRAEGRQAS